MGKYTGFYGNKLFSGNKIATAREGHFYNGYTELDLYDLHSATEGRDGLLDANIKALVPHKQDLVDGKRVNVHLTWDLTEDKSDYLNVEFIKTEVVEKEED